MLIRCDELTNCSSAGDHCQSDGTTFTVTVIRLSLMAVLFVGVISLSGYLAESGVVNLVTETATAAFIRFAVAARCIVLHRAFRLLCMNQVSQLIRPKCDADLHLIRIVSGNQDSPIVKWLDESG